MAQDYYLMYHENIPTAQLVYRVALVMQEYTQVCHDMQYLGALFRSLIMMHYFN